MSDLRSLVSRPGANDLPYVHPAFPDRPLVLRSACPRNFGPATRLVFAFHGAARNGGDYRDFWLPFIDAANLLVIVPEFPADSFPGTRWFNFGAVIDEESAPQARGRWTYRIHQELFAELRSAGIVAGRGYGLFGHSAGGQFVQRLMTLGVVENVDIAIAANAGTYAMPQADIPYPYGLGGLQFDDAALARAFSYPLTIMIGADDVETSGPAFPNEPEAMAQGETRHARAHRFFDRSRQEATARSVPFNWRIIDVPGVAHVGARMTEAAARLLASELPAVRPQDSFAA